jgi:tetratricopeptide (TPR) repeat protein
MNKRLIGGFGSICFLLASLLFAVLIHADTNPEAVEYNTQGCQAIERGLYKDAIRLLTKAIEKDPKYDKAYYNRALAYAWMNKFDEALPDYNKAIEINPNYSKALVGRGKVLQNKKKIKEALMDFNKAIEVGTDDPDAYYNRGVIYLEGKIEDQGIKDFLKATEIDPKYYKAYYNIACVYSINNEAEKALVYLEKAVDTGMKDLDFVMKDPDLDNIRNSEGFKKIIQKLKGK